MAKITENPNKNSQNLDLKDSSNLVQCFLDEDQVVLEALKKAKSELADLVEAIYEKLKNHQEVYLPYNGLEDYQGPKVFYFGAGTSGRLGILDASECPPTFSAHPDFVNGVIAGGSPAITSAVENAEDNAAAAKDFVEKNLSADDIAIGISANGNAAYVCAALEAAQAKGSLTAAIANNSDAKIFDLAAYKVFLDTGPEIITGSTRLKAGTAQKMTLNIISSSVMVKLGKVYGNLMVDLQAKNIKLKKRALNLVTKIAEVDDASAQKALDENDFKVKNAVLALKKKLSPQEAENLLKQNQYNLRVSLG